MEVLRENEGEVSSQQAEPEATERWRRQWAGGQRNYGASSGPEPIDRVWWKTRIGS
jgi:hypothetical protein